MIPFWLMHRKRYKGMHLWVIDFVFQIFGNIFYVIRGDIPEVVAIIGGNCSFTIGNFLLFVGLQQFYDKKPRFLFTGILLIVIQALSLFYYSIIVDNMTIRSTIINVVLCFQMLSIAVFILKGISSEYRSISRPIAIAALCFAVASVARIVNSYVVPSGNNFYTSPNAFVGYWLLTLQILSILLTITIFFAVTSRLSLEIRQSFLYLTESENRYRSIADYSPSAIIIVNNERNVFYHNPEFLTLSEYETSEINGVDFTLFFEKHSRQLLKERYEARQKGEATPWCYESSIITKRKKPRSVEIRASVFDDHLNHKCTMLQIIDITDRKKNEKELRMYHAELEKVVEERTHQLLQAEKMASIGILAAGIAHEISNPNNFIMMNTPLMKKGWNTVLPILEKLPDITSYHVDKMSLSDFLKHALPLTDRIYKGAERIDRIVSELTNYSKIDTSENDKLHDFNNIVVQALHIIENYVQNKTTNLELNFSPSPILVKGSFQKLEQLVINLVRNACDSLPDTSKAVRISTSLNDDHTTALLVVQDEGCGIDKVNLSKITDPFFTTKRESGGTGLGLSICLNIIQSHKGEIRFVSEPNIGTTVTIFLPAGDYDV
jgi:PAS domain S-box-containing protein